MSVSAGVRAGHAGAAPCTRVTWSSSLEAVVLLCVDEELKRIKVEQNAERTPIDPIAAVFSIDDAAHESSDRLLPQAFHDSCDPAYRELGLFEHLHRGFAREEPKVCAIEDAVRGVVPAMSQETANDEAIGDIGEACHERPAFG